MYQKYFQRCQKKLFILQKLQKVIVEVAITENPEFRYIVESDAKSIIDTKSMLSEKEFEVFIKEQFKLDYYNICFVA